MAIRAASLMIDVDADVKAAQSKIQSVDKDLKSLAKTDAEVKVDADTDGAQQEVQELEKVLVRIAGQEVEVAVDANLNPALAEIAKAEREARALEDIDPVIDIKADASPAVAEMNKIERAAMGMGNQVSLAAGSIKSQMIGIAGGVGIATAAIGILGKGFGFVKGAVFDTNATIEETRATLLALTKDAGETERLIGQINDVAGKTPYTFDQVASSYTSLLPITKQYRVQLEDLVEVSQLLAASNPAEGLEGAAFAIREAMSGDFTSLIERFNLSRAAINQMKEDGVPALEIIRQSMQGMGIDAEMLALRAETTRAKWNTFVDDLKLGIAKAGEPLFKAIGVGLDALIDSQDDVAAVLKDIQTIGTALSNLPPFVGIKIALEAGGDQAVWDVMKTAVATAASGGSIAMGTPQGRKGAGMVFDVVVQGAEAINTAADYVGRTPGEDDINRQASAFQDYVDAYIQGTGYIIENQDAVNQSAEAWFFQNQQNEAQLARLAKGAEERTQAEHDLAAAQSQRQAINDELVRQEMAYLNVASNTEIAITRLILASGQLASIQGTLNTVMGAFSAQGAEYNSTASALEKGYEIIQQKQADGIELSTSEQKLLDNYPELYGRIKGAQEDAAEQEGLVAAAKIGVMQAQDQLNEAIARGETDLGPYNEKLKDARDYLSDVDPQSGAQIAIENLTTAINGDLVTAINDLIGKLDELNGKEAKPKIELDGTAFDQGVGQSKQKLTEFDQAQAEPTADLDHQPFDDGVGHVESELGRINGQSATVTVEAHFITTGDPLAMQVYGQQTGSGYVGITAGGNAAGGIIDRPMLSMIGEEAPAHPEFIIPTNPARRGRAMGLWLDAGRALGVPGFADGGGGRTLAGNTGGVAAGQPVGDIDWSWLFEGIDIEAKDYTKRVADAFDGLFRDIRKLATGEAARDAQKELDRLLTVKQIAIETGAGADVIAGLDAQIAAQQAQVQAIGAAMGTDIVAGIQSEILNANFAEDVATAWDASLRNFDSILSGDRITALEQTIEKLGEQLNIAKVVGAPEEVVAAIAENLAAAQRELATSQQIYDQALEAGLVDIAEPFRIPLEELTALMPQMKDGGIGLIDELIEGIADGSTNLAGVMGTVDKIIEAGTDKSKETIGATGAEMMETLQKLEEQLTVELAQALISGSEETVAAIEAQIKVIDDLMSHVELTADTTVKSLQRINEVSGQIIKPPSGMGSSSSSGGFNATDVRNGTVRIGNAINLTMADGNQVAQWYADQQYRDEQLAPVGIGG